MQKHYYSKTDFNDVNNIINDKYINQILLGDSELLLRELPNNCIDLIFTSPPYNFGKRYNNTDDSHSWEIYFQHLFSIFAECIRVLKYGGRIIVNVQPHFSDYIPTHHIISNYFMGQGLIWKGEIIWNKNHYNCKTTAWGSWKSPSSPYLKYTWEFLEIFCKGVIKKDGLREHADIDKTDFRHWVNAMWSVTPETRMQQFNHPAMFPEELAKRALMLFSFKHDIVLDPFVGTGTTCVVAKSLNRKYIGMDISEEYINTALKRIENIQLKLDMPLTNS